MMDTKKSVALEIEKSKDEPTDKFGIVYTLFFFLGITNFIPATFFITAHDYWMYKFRNTTFDKIDSEHRTTLQIEFSPGVTIALHLSTVTFSFLTLVFGHKFSERLKLYGSLILVICFFMIAAAFIHIDTDSWQTGFFILTIFTIALINGGTAVFGMATFTVLSNFSSEFLGAHLNGAGVAAIFTAVLQILSLAIGISTTKSAILYFWLAIAEIVFALIFLIAVSKYNRFFNYKMKNQKDIKKEKSMSLRQFWETFKLIWPSLTILLFYLLTINPTHTSITSLVVSEGEGNGPWNDVYFVPVITFFMYSVFEYLGRIAALKIQTNISGVWFAAFSGLRIFIFVPLILLCNAQPRHHLPVIFPHDYQYILIMMTLAFSSGYLLFTGNIIIPKTVPPEKLEDAYHVNLLGAGILFGALTFLSLISVDFI